MDVDHLIPLAEVWDSGASAWTAKEREAYANDLDAPRALIAVSAASNRSKADEDPTDWLPPYAPYGCRYVTHWIADKTRYQLTIGPAERTALTERLAACPDQPVTLSTLPPSPSTPVPRCPPAPGTGRSSSGHDQKASSEWRGHVERRIRHHGGSDGPA
ncbi:GmrSD restriction endonuclease domain-containing protein [Streptomyces sp. NPDC001076]